MKGEPRRTSALGVMLHGKQIGTILRLAGDRQVFLFEQSYVDDETRATLSLSFKRLDGGLLTTPVQARRRVPSFFANLLPEGHLREYLAGQAGVNPQREFFLLEALGADLAGAVTIVSIDGATEAEEKKQEASDRRRERRRLRFSLAGVQLKFSAIGEARGGLTIPAEGMGGAWIVKLPSQIYEGVAENEFVMLELAREIGLVVPRIRLVPVKEIEGLPMVAQSIRGNALAVERFDRGVGGGRIHMEDFAQVFGQFPEDKYKAVSYANIARVLWQETGQEGAYEFIRRLTFSVLIGNADMHLKNWSILYPDQRRAVLAPAYDFVSTVPYISEDKLALSFGGGRSLAGISFDQVRRLTEKAGMPLEPALALVRETAEAVVEKWRGLKQRDALPRVIDAAIDLQIGKAARGILVRS